METYKQLSESSGQQVANPKDIGPCLLKSVVDMQEHGYCSAEVSQHESGNPPYRTHNGESLDLVCSACGAGCNITHNGAEMLHVIGMPLAPSLVTCPKTKALQSEPTPETQTNKQ